MKKFLSLVLALVMTMSLVTVAGAEDFTDADDVTYVEAVDVISAMGIVGGYADGSFNPEGTLTRGAAAKIICNILVGVDTASSLVANTAPYADVPANHTFAGYIAYCAEKGIVSGYADGTFRPAATLTGYAFMKMLLGALGYDQTIEGYTGTNWAINVAEDVVDKDLTYNLVGTFNGNKAITREEACLYALNALTALTVDYEDKGQNITIGGVEISTAASKAEDTEDYLCETHFKSLDWNEDTDAFGRPALTWEYDKEEIGTYLIEADESYTGKVKGEEIYKDLGKAKVHEITLVKNGEPVETEKKIAKGSKDEFGAAESLFEVYVTDCEVEGHEKEKDVYIVEIKYTPAEIEKVYDVKYDKDGDVKKEAYVTLKEGGSFETTGFEKGEIVLIAKVGSEIKDMIAAESVEGKVTSAKGGKLTIDGVAYANNTEAGLGSKGEYFLGVDGSIVKFVGETNKSSDYALIYNVTKSENKVNADGLAVAVEYTAYVVLDDGEKASYVLTDDMATLINAAGIVAGTVTEAPVVCYDLDDGKLDVATAEDDMADFTGELGNAKVEGKFFTAKTEFIFVNIDTEDGKVTTEVETGYKNLEKQTVSYTAVFDEDDIVSKVFILGEAAAATSDATYAILVDDAASYTEDDDDNVYATYIVSIDGEETELTFKNEEIDLDVLAEGDAFEYTLKGDYVDTCKVIDTMVKDAKVNSVIDDYVVVDGAAMYLNDEAEVYLVETDDDGVTTVSETTLAKDDVIDYVKVGGTGKDKDEIKFVLVTRVEVEA